MTDPQFRCQIHCDIDYNPCAGQITTKKSKNYGCVLRACEKGWEKNDPQGLWKERIPARNIPGINAGTVLSLEKGSLPLGALTSEVSGFKVENA